MKKMAFNVRIRTEDGTELRRIEGYKYTLNDKLFIVHKEPKYNETWSISEYTSGLECGVYCDTRNQTIEDFKTKVSSLGIEHLENAIKRAIGTYGVANIY